MTTIGIPMERKTKEGRIALTPYAAAELVAAGHEVFIETKAGELSGFYDEEYLKAGCKIAPDQASLYASADLIVKVKEPIDADLKYIEARHTLFCYLHLAACPELTERLQTIGCTAIAFETVTEGPGQGLPLLTPMSIIAGRIAVLMGANHLGASQGGRGVLLGGIPSIHTGKVVVVGAGVAGAESAAVAARLGAQVVVFDKKTEALTRARNLGDNVTALASYEQLIAEEVKNADLVIGAVLIPGAKAPKLITREMIQSMPKGSVVVDIAIDQGGCIETIKPTTYENPAYEEEGVVHIGVTNMPGAYPRSSTLALSAAISPYVLRLCSKGLEDPAIKAGLNVQAGEIMLDALK
ncbi:MAG: alanine dehydrogenase [Pseudomonadota bacterium]|nr:alanine dehydrogenase [Pseudomonadota bacterium]